MHASRTLRASLVAALVVGGLTVLTPTAAQAGVGTATVVNRWSTSTGAWSTKPSPDPSGITYGGGKLIISDGEVEEIPALYKGANIFYASLTGAPDHAKAWTTMPSSDEPTGISTFGNLFAISDDTGTRGVYLFNAGADGRWVNGQDPKPKFFPGGTFATDPEDLTVDSDVTKDGHIVVVSGANKEVVDYSAGPDGNFATTGDNVVTHFDVQKYGALDPEGIEYEAVRNTLLVLDHTSNKIYELDRAGALLNTVPLPTGIFTKAAGMTFAPGTDVGSNLFVVDRGVDNNTNPNQNDGQVVELRLTLPPLGGGGDTIAPTVTAKTPPANRTGVSRTANVTVTFSEAVKNVTSATFFLKDPAGNLVAAAAPKNTAGTNKWVLNPSVTLAANTTYTATVVGPSGVEDLAGNDLDPGVSWSFRTGA
jgi:hypothetical protein